MKAGNKKTGKSGLVMGAIFLVIGLVTIKEAIVAYEAHSLIFKRYRGGGGGWWMEPWQGFCGGTVAIGLGVWCFVCWIHRRRSDSRTSSIDRA